MLKMFIKHKIITEKISFLPNILVRNFHITPRFLGKEEDREALHRENEALVDNEQQLHLRLLNTNDKIAEFYHHLISKNVIDETVKEDIDNIYHESEIKSEDAEDDFR
jgi:lipid A disaccharide synthetase